MFWKEHFKESHEAKRWKLTLVDNPDDPDTKVQAVVLDDCKELREADVGFPVEVGIFRLTNEAQMLLSHAQQTYPEQAKEFFRHLIQPSGTEDQQYKRLRLTAIQYKDCMKKTIVHERGQQDVDAPSQPTPGPGDDEEVEKVRKPDDLPGFWWKLNKRDWAYVYTVRPCKGENDDGEGDDVEDAQSMVGSVALGKQYLDPEVELQKKLEGINLTVIASGVSNLGHRRARLKAKRDLWMTPGNSEADKHAAGRVTLRLGLGVTAEDLSKAHQIHHLTTSVVQDKIADLVGGGMVIPVNIAVEQTNRDCSDISKDLVMENPGSKKEVLAFFGVALPVKMRTSDVDDDEDLMAVDDHEEYDYKFPKAFPIPGWPEQKVMRFESATFSYLITPLLKAWGVTKPKDKCVLILLDIESVLINNLPIELDPLFQVSINDVVSCGRGLRYLVDPLNETFQEDYQSLNDAEALPGKWKGIKYMTFTLLQDLPSFRPSIASITRTKVSKIPFQKYRITRSQDTPNVGSQTGLMILHTLKQTNTNHN